jgi:hypothetical protein
MNFLYQQLLLKNWILFSDITKDHVAYMNDAMSVGQNMEIWCRSKRQLNLADLSKGGISNGGFICDPELILFRMLGSFTSGLL